MLLKVLSKSDKYIPQQQHPGDAGLDLVACGDYIIPAAQHKIVDCGFAMELEEGYEAQIRPRSGLAAKKSITVLNSPGTIDAGYRDTVKAILINHGIEDFVIKDGDRIAQMVIQIVPKVEIVTVNMLSESSRGKGGLGSTGGACLK
jgi:dUTP pyrophosphatase